MTTKEHPKVKIRTRTGLLLVPRVEFERWLASASTPELPALRTGQLYPALDYLRASIAREMLRRRIAAGLSRAALALASGVSRATIARAETGRQIPTERVLRRIEHVLTQDASASVHRRIRRLGKPPVGQILSTKKP